MKKTFLALLIVSCFFACTTSKNKINQINGGLTIAFGSCNNQKIENLLWKEIIKHNPSVWIWGGDIVYSDTENMDTLQHDFQDVLHNRDYKKLKQNTKIVGTWDDHDYGMNDGGATFRAKKANQQAFLDFMGVSKTDERRKQEGVYHADIIKTPQGSVKIILLSCG